MANTRLHHDLAFAAATACIDTVAHALLRGERKEAFEMFYKAFRAALEKYDAVRKLEGGRLKPSRN